MRLRDFLFSSLRRSLVTGLVVALLVALAEGLFLRGTPRERFGQDWLYSLALYGWLGLTSGLLWGGILAAIDRGRRAPALHSWLLIPGLILLHTVLVGGYWLNTWERMPGFHTQQGKLWSLGFLTVAAVVAAAWALLAKRRAGAPSPPGGRAAGDPIMVAAGALLALLPVVGVAFDGNDSGAAKSSGDEQRPPVIVILVDTLRRDHLETFGYDRPTSPNLKQFAQDAIRFSEASTTGNMTVPSVSTLFTGLYPSSHRTVEVLDPLPLDEPTLAQTLGAGGYRTAAFVGNVVVRPELGYDRGFQQFHPQRPPRWMGRRKTALELLATRLTQTQNFHFMGRLILESKRWLQQGQGSPFLYLHLLEPHSPYAPPPRSMNLFVEGQHEDLPHQPPLIRHYRPGNAWVSWEDLEIKPDIPPATRDLMKDLYDGEIHHVDEGLGGFFEQLRSTELYDESIIVFLSDHGEEFEDHDGWFHGLTLYQEMTAMPLMIKLPGSRGGGLNTNLSLDMIDLYPTLCGLTGLEVPAHCQGRDRSEAILRLAAGMNVEEEVFSYTERPPYLQALRAGRWKVLRKDWGGRVDLRLFDLINDPKESEDLAAALPDTLDHMRRLLEAVMARVGADAEGWDREGPGEIDPELEEQLRNLGYIGGG